MELELELERTRLQQRKAISKKRKQEKLGIDGDTNTSCSSDNGGITIDKLPDDLLINILSHMSLNGSARASVLARRWRYLWRFAHRTLLFDDTDSLTGKAMEREKFDSWVNNVLHQARDIEGVVITLEEKGDVSSTTHKKYDSLVQFALQKEVQRFELNLSFCYQYEFPSLEHLISPSYGVSAPLNRLRILRLAYVDIKDEVVHYFLASCPNLEELSIHSSDFTENLRVIDPPSSRVLEISRCSGLNGLEISAAQLVSLTYRGPRKMLLLEKVPSLRELTMWDGLCISFVTQPKEHWSYSVQLEKLVLDFRLLDSNSLEVSPDDFPQLCSLKRLEVFAVAGRTLLVFTQLIKASPQLREFRIERMSYTVRSWIWNAEKVPFRGTKSGAKKAVEFVHRNLKVVEIGGYAGCRGEEELVLALITIGPSIERVVIDIETDCFSLESYIALRRAQAQRYDGSVPFLCREAEPPYETEQRSAPNILHPKYRSESNSLSHNYTSLHLFTSNFCFIIFS